MLFDAVGCFNYSRLIELTFQLFYLTVLQTYKFLSHKSEVINSEFIGCSLSSRFINSTKTITYFFSGLFGLCCLHCLMCSVSSRLDEHCLAGYCGLVALRTKLRLMNGIEVSLHLCGQNIPISKINNNVI